MSKWENGDTPAKHPFKLLVMCALLAVLLQGLGVGSGTASWIGIGVFLVMLFLGPLMRWTDRANARLDARLERDHPSGGAPKPRGPQA